MSAKQAINDINYKVVYTVSQKRPPSIQKSKMARVVQVSFELPSKLKRAVSYIYARILQQVDIYSQRPKNSIKSTPPSQ